MEKYYIDSLLHSDHVLNHFSEEELTGKQPEEPKKVPFTEIKQGFRNSLSAAKKDIENARK